MPQHPSPASAEKLGCGGTAQPLETGSMPQRSQSLREGLVFTVPQRGLRKPASAESQRL